MLLRSLMNIRMPGKIDKEFQQIQDAYLAEENARRGIVTLAEMQELSTDIYLWKGDITRLQVGPIVQGRLTTEHERLLCSCLRIAEENSVESIAFCCISTGVFMFPNERAAELAVQTVKEYKNKTNSKIKVIFNVFKDEDERIYRQLLN